VGALCAQFFLAIPRSPHSGWFWNLGFVEILREVSGLRLNESDVGSAEATVFEFNLRLEAECSVLMWQNCAAKSKYRVPSWQRQDEIKKTCSGVQ
jgi:hypothetical protein